MVMLCDSASATMKKCNLIATGGTFSLILQGSPSSFDRTSFLVTYSGEGNADDNDPACGDIYDVSQFMICEVEFDCRCQDTYACVRSVYLGGLERIS